MKKVTPHDFLLTFETFNRFSGYRSTFSLGLFTSDIPADSDGSVAGIRRLHGELINRHRDRSVTPSTWVYGTSFDAFQAWAQGVIAGRATEDDVADTDEADDYAAYLACAPGP